MLIRSASLHIREKDLADVLHKILNEDSPIEFDTNSLAKRILNEAKTLSCSSRSVYASNERIGKKTEKLKLAGRSDTGIFAQLLLLHRRKLHHKGLQLIEPGSNDWLNLKETCKLATEFCNEFGLSIKQGYHEYLTIGLSKMKNFSVFKFKSMHSAICNHFEAYQELQSDNHREESERMYNCYMALINEKLGWTSDNYKDNPEKMVCFTRATTAAKKMGIDVKIYLKAQFAAMDWGEKTLIPDPLQLYGDKATQRVVKYCYENSIAIRQAKRVDFKKLKHG